MTKEALAKRRRAKAGGAEQRCLRLPASSGARRAGLLGPAASGFEAVRS